MGYIDSTGRIVIEPKFDYAQVFSEELAAVEVNKEYFFIPCDSTIKSYKIAASEIDSMSKQCGQIQECRGRYGYINTGGGFVIPPIYDCGKNYSEGLAAVNIGGYYDDDGSFDGGKWGFIDKEGKINIEHKFEFAADFSEGVAYVKNGYDSSGYIDKSGNLVIPIIAESVGNFKNGYATFENPSEYGYIDKTGKRFPGPLLTGENMTIIEQEGKFGYSDPLGHIVIPPIYESAQLFIDGITRVRLDAKWGFIKKDGAYHCTPQYEFLYDYSDGAARILEDGLAGYIDTDCNIIIAPQFDEAEDFHDGLAWVSIGEKVAGYINKYGQFVWKAENRE